MKVLLFNTKTDYHIHLLGVDVTLQKVDSLTTCMINHNVVSLRRVINHRTSNDIITNDDCSTLVRLEGGITLLRFLEEMRYICGIKSNVYDELIIYIFKKCGLYRLIADDIVANIFKER